MHTDAIVADLAAEAQAKREAARRKRLAYQAAWSVRRRNALMAAVVAEQARAMLAALRPVDAVVLTQPQGGTPHWWVVWSCGRRLGQGTTELAALRQAVSRVRRR